MSYPYDLDRDGDVDSDDSSIVSANSGHSLTILSAPATTIETIAYTYDADSRLTAVTDHDGDDISLSADYTYTYDNLGRVTNTTSDNILMSDTVGLNQTFDDNGNRTSLAAQVPGITANDFVNDYSYDALNRMTQITQQSLLAYNEDGANPDGIFEIYGSREVDFAYNAASQFDTIDRYDDVGLVATTTYGYDDAGRMNSLDQSGVTTYGYTYDAANRLATLTNSADTSENATYTYDALGQLTAADYENYSSNNEGYTYDANGNWLASTTANDGSRSFTVSGNNQVTSDGTYDYEYDNEGNLINKYLHGTTTVVRHYTYDYRNRLTEVTGSGLDVKYLYDAFNRLIGRTSDVSGEPARQTFVYDGNQMILHFAGTAEESLGAAQLTDRYLWGPAVDMLLTHEQVSSDTYTTFMDEPTASVEWALLDGQNSVRDILTRDPDTSGLHLDSDSFGNDTYGGSNQEMIAWTGRFHDPDTGLQWNGARWYNSTIGRWMSQDPLGLMPGPNPYEYAYNSPTNFVDPSGLWGKASGQGPGFWPTFFSVLGTEVKSIGEFYSGNSEQAYKDGPFGQSSGGVRTAVGVSLGVSSVAIVSAAGVGAGEYFFLDNEPIYLWGAPEPPPLGGPEPYSPTPRVDPNQRTTGFEQLEDRNPDSGPVFGPPHVPVPGG